MSHTRAEVATAAGTAMAGTLFCASGAAHESIEEIATASTGPKWFQIYMNRDMGINEWLCQRAKAAGFSAIVLTADALGPGQSDEYAVSGVLQRRAKRKATTTLLAGVAAPSPTKSAICVSATSASYATHRDSRSLSKASVTRRTYAKRSPPVRPRSGCPTTGAASSMASQRQFRCWHLRLMSWLVVCRSSSTVGSVEELMCSRLWLWAQQSWGLAGLSSGA